MSRLTVILATLAFSMVSASAATAGEVRLEHMTWLEVQDALKAGKTTVIIPTGGVEQHGAHMILGKHNFIVAETAKRIAGKLGDALVAPVMPYVPEGDITKREGHMAYPGTISVPPEAFAMILQAAAESFRAHGFKNIVLLGDHGQSIPAQGAVAKVLSQNWAADGVRVINAENYYGKSGGVEWLKAQGETDAQIGEHAGIRDTSELMAVFPAGVHAGRRVANKDGVNGDPTRATVERGQTLIDLKVEAAVKEIEAARKAPIAATQSSGGIWQSLWRWIFG